MCLPPTSNFQYLHDTLLKLDELGHDVTTMPVSGERDRHPHGKGAHERYQGDQFAGIHRGAGCYPGADRQPDRVPSASRSWVPPSCGRCSSKPSPKNFSDLIQISGLSHGTDVWNGNAQDLIKDGVCTISDVIGCRDSIMTYLLHKGLKPKLAFNIVKELTRKEPRGSRRFPPGAEETMKMRRTDWYMDSCRKIKYMFPKAHAVAYLIAAIRLMWFEVYHSQAFYTCFYRSRR